VFDFVNSYYEQVSPIIRTFKGFIVKYMGDGIMAVCLKDGVPETWTGDTVMNNKMTKDFDGLRRMVSAFPSGQSP
jgi:hypothetical protein